MTPRLEAVWPARGGCWGPEPALPGARYGTAAAIGWAPVARVQDPSTLPAPTTAQERRIRARMASGWVTSPQE